MCSSDLGSLNEVRTRGDQAKADFYRARDEKVQLEGTVVSQREEIASLKAEIVAQREVLMTKERSLRTTAARCKELEGMVKFRDEADARWEILRTKEFEELEKDKETIEDSRSQARIAWDHHEKVSSELVAVQDELEKSLAGLQEENENPRCTAGRSTMF